MEEKEHKLLEDNQNTMEQKMRFTDEELELLRNTFGGNEVLVKLMRKMFCPEVDLNAPIGQVIDIYSSVQTDGKKPEEIAVAVMARNFLWRHLEQCLMELTILANNTREDLDAMRKSAEKNSAR